MAHAKQLVRKKPFSGQKRIREVTPEELEPKPWVWPSWLGPVILCAILVFFALIRLRLRDIPLERDEGEYAYAGQLIMQGIPPYKLVYNMKLPGTYAAYALTMALLGQTPAAIHLGLVLLNAGTSVMMFFLARRLFGQIAALSTAFAYALLSTSPDILGFQAHATHFVVFAALAGLTLLLRAIVLERLYLFCLSGFMFGLAFLMKQPGLFFCFFGVLYLFYRQWRETQPWPLARRRILAFGIGAAVPFLLTCLIMLAAGVFEKFRFWVFDYAYAYTAITPFTEGVETFVENFSKIAAPTFAIWLFAGVGLSAFMWDRTIRRHIVFVILFLSFSFFAVCPGLYFRPHYFILMLPAVALLAGVAVDAVTRLLRNHASVRKVAWIPALLFLAGATYAIVVRAEFYFKMDGLQACRYLYGKDESFPEAVVIGERIRKTTPKSARVAVLGSEPEIYFYADRHSATGYIYNFALMENQQFAERMQQEMFDEIEAANPEYLIIDMQLWLLSDSIGVRDRHDWTERYIKNYHTDGILLDMQNGAALYFGSVPSNFQQKDIRVYVLRRNDS